MMTESSTGPELRSQHTKAVRAAVDIPKKTNLSLGVPPPPVSPTGLLRLPIEVRLQIYRYCIPRKCILEASYPSFPFKSDYDMDDPVDEVAVIKNETLDFEDTLQLPDTPCSRDVGAPPDLGTIETSNTINESHWWRPWNSLNNSIFLLSKQISNEALDILYGENIFRLRLDNDRGENFLEHNFTKQNLQRIRYLLLTAEWREVLFSRDRMPVTTLWSSVLPRLKGMRIIAEQPVEPRSYFSGPSLEQELDHWVKWVKPFLQCFGKHLSKETTVQVDINCRAETRELIRNCLPHGYQEIRCRQLGDLIFKRGNYSLESGYWDDNSIHLSSDSDN